MAQIPQISDELLLRAFSRPSLGQTIQAGTEGFGTGVDIGSKLAEQKARRKKEEQDLLQQIEQLKLESRKTKAGMITPDLSAKAPREMTPEVYKALNPEEKTPGPGQADFIKTTFTGNDGKSYALWGRSGQVTEVPVTASGPMVKPTAPGEMVQQFGDFQTVLDQLQRVKETKKPEFVGPVQGRLTTASQTTGIGASSQAADFLANVNSIRNQLIYLRSGKQINDKEYERLLKELPNEFKSDVDFDAKLSNFEKVFTGIMNNRRAALGQAYSNVPKPAGQTPTQGGLTPEKAARLAELRAKKASGTLR